MTSGLGGFAYGQDSVAAKLSLDLPNDAEENLKHISEYSESLRVNMEASSRFTGDYINYLRSFPEIQRAVLDIQKEQLGILQQTQSVYENIRNSQSAAFMPPGYAQQGQQPYQVNDAGRVMPIGVPYPNFYDHNGERMPPGYERFHSPLQNSQNPTERHNATVQDEIERQRLVRERVIEREEERLRRVRQDQRIPEPNDNNSSGTGGRHRRPNTPDEPEPGEDLGGTLDRRVRSGAEGAAGAADDALRLISPGGSNASRLMALRNVIDTVRNHTPEWAGGALKGLGIAGAGAAGLWAVNNIVQNTGEAVQGLRNQDLRTHSLSGGLGVQADVAMMALNPLLTNEQSREIIMGAMKSGYTGKTYESAVDFIKSNLIDMNMEVGKSVELLKNNVDLGNQSIQSLKFDLLSNQALAQLGPATTDQLGAQFGAVNGALTSAGTNAAAASSAASFSNSMFNTVAADGSPNPIGQAGQDGLNAWTKIVTAAIASKPFTARINNRFTPNTLLINTWDEVGANASQYIYKLLQEDAKRMDFQGFSALASTYGILGALGGDVSMLRSLYEQLRSRESNAINEAKDQQAELNKTEVNGKSVVDLPTFEEYRAQPGNENKNQGEYNNFITGNDNGARPEVDSSVLTRIIQSDTDKKLVIIDDKGKAHLLNPQSWEQQQGLAKGTWKIVDSGQTWDTKRDDAGNLVTRGSGRFGGRDHQNSDLAEDLGNLDLSGRAAVESGKDWSIAALSQNNSEQSKQDTNYQNQGDFGADGGAGLFGQRSESGGGGGFDISHPGAGLEQQTWLLDITPGAQRFLLKGQYPGQVADNPQANAANSGANGETRNGGG